LGANAHRAGANSGSRRPRNRYTRCVLRAWGDQTVLLIDDFAAAALLVIATTVAVMSRDTHDNIAQDAVRARMDLWSASLGVGCDHCHVPDRWADETKPTFDFARRMSRMVDGLNTGVLKELGGVTCWTCHRGQPRPARLPIETWTAIRDRHTADFARKPDRALVMSVYSASLGVACTHCHADGDWAATSKPAHTTVETMNRIFEEIPRYFDASVRAPRTQCFMCHQGAVSPHRTRRGQ
jgi:hypothetical protein